MTIYDVNVVRYLVMQTFETKIINSFGKVVFDIKVVHSH